MAIGRHLPNSNKFHSGRRKCHPSQRNLPYVVSNISRLISLNNKCTIALTQALGWRWAANSPANSSAAQCAKWYNCTHGVIHNGGFRTENTLKRIFSSTSNLRRSVIYIHRVRWDPKHLPTAQYFLQRTFPTGPSSGCATITSYRHSHQPNHPDSRIRESG